MHNLLQHAGCMQTRFEDPDLHQQTESSLRARQAYIYGRWLEAVDMDRGNLFIQTFDIC